MASIEDGPNDENMYLEAPLRIIHLLKQPTLNAGPIPALVQKIVGDNRLGRKFMYRVAQRSFGLLNKFASWKEVRRQNDEALGKALLQSGIVNIRNDQIASTTPKGRLSDWAEQYKPRWHGQIAKYKPQLVVCGGTFGAIEKALEQKSTTATTGMRWFEDPKVRECIYVDAPHPTARYPVAMVYTYLMVSAREMLGES